VSPKILSSVASAHQGRRSTPSGTEGIISDRKYVFAVNQTRSELLVVDSKSVEIVKKVALDQPPSTLALSPDGRNSTSPSGTKCPAR
jgi:DNA-binding beta-propeller fold protein YncE